MKRLPVLVVALAVALVALPACGGSGSGGGTRTLSIDGADFKYDAPATAKGGVTTINFRNTAATENHEVQLLRLDGAHTLNEALAGLKNGSIPDFAHGAGGVAQVKPGASASATQKLTAGNYMLVCFISGRDGTPHFVKGMTRELRVSGSGGGSLPAASGTVTGSEYKFEVPGLTAGTHTLRFENTGPAQVHQASLVEFPPGTTVDQVNQLIQAFASNQPPQQSPQPTGVGGAEALDPGGAVNFTVALDANRVYAFVCFLPDRGGGAPHIAKGMAKAFFASSPVN